LRPPRSWRENPSPTPFPSPSPQRTPRLKTKKSDINGYIPLLPIRPFPPQADPPLAETLFRVFRAFSSLKKYSTAPPRPPPQPFCVFLCLLWLKKISQQTTPPKPTTLCTLRAFALKQVSHHKTPTASPPCSPCPPWFKKYPIQRLRPTPRAPPKYSLRSLRLSRLCVKISPSQRPRPTPSTLLCFSVPSVV
jgi:hypothetical protein